MDKQEALAQHIANTFVYGRTYYSGQIAVHQIISDTRIPHDRAYYEKIIKFVRNELKQVPADILIATAATQLPDNTKTYQPLTFLIMQSSARTLPALAKAEHAVWTPQSSYMERRLGSAGGLYMDRPCIKIRAKDEWKRRIGLIVVGYDRIKPYQWLEIPHVHTLIHELGHHYLEACLSPKKRKVFLSELTQAVAKDRQVGEAVNKKPIYGDFDSDSEYFTHSLQQLTGGTNKHRIDDEYRKFEFEECPYTLTCLLKHHPSWITMVEKQAPRFAETWKEQHPEHAGIWQQAEEERRTGRIRRL